MREVVSMHIGQAGVQMGDSLWDLFCIEHGIQPDGYFIKHVDESRDSSFFKINENERAAPIAVLCDLEPTVIDVIKNGKYKDLFCNDSMLSYSEDAASNYGRGRYTVGQFFIEQTMDSIRRLLDTCDSLHGFMFYHSFGGGTGSGFTSLLLEVLCDECVKKSKIEIGVYPAPQVSTSVVEPYNTIFSTHSTIDRSQCSFIVDNEAMYHICQKLLQLDAPRYSDLNRIVAQAMSSLTASIRFEGPLNVDFNEFHTNLVPFPRIHYPTIAYAPITGPNDTSSYRGDTVPEITRACFDEQNRLIKCSTVDNKYMACALLYRGDVTHKDVNQVVAKLKASRVIRFVDWSPAGIKVGINWKPPGVFEGQPELHRSLCVISNSTAISDAWKNINTKFDLLYSKKAFVHWFAYDGVEFDEFEESREDCAVLERDYTELGADSECNSEDYHSSSKIDEYAY